MKIDEEIVIRNKAYSILLFAGILAILPSKVVSGEPVVEWEKTFGGSSFAGTIQLPQTGQTKCYDTAGNEISCTETGQDGEIQAGVPWPEPRFVIIYCSSTAPCTDQSSDCDCNASTDIVIDKLTGLMWTRNGNLAGVKDWYQSIDYVNNLNLGGYSDWRLPNINELESLLNTEEQYSSTWLNDQGFKNVQYDWYWSSTTRAYTANLGPQMDSAWTMSMMVGWIVPLSKGPGGGIYLLPVRAGQFGSPDITYPANIWKTGQAISYYPGDDGDIQAGVSWPSNRFTDNSDGMIIDSLTGLIWTKDAKSFSIETCTVGNRAWQDALDYAKCLNINKYLGYSDWRLPNRKELYSLYDYSQYYPALPAGHPFINLKFLGNDDHWSSTTVGAYPYSYAVAWLFRLTSEGGVGGSWKNNPFYYNYSAWPVRGPQEPKAESPWPMFQHDPQHTGRSPYVGPCMSGVPDVRTLIQGGRDGDFICTPLIGPNDILYLPAIINGVEGVYAFERDGTQKWVYPAIPLGFPANSIAITPEGNLFFCVYDGNTDLIMLRPNGNIKWRSSLIGAYPVGYPSVTNDGTIYLLANSTAGDSGKLIAIDSTSGDIIWEYGFDGHIWGRSPTVGRDGTIYFGYGNTLFAITQDGKKKWERIFPPTYTWYQGSPYVVTPSIADDGTVYAVVKNEKDWITLTDAGTSHCVHALNPDNPEQDKWVQCSKFFNLAPFPVSSQGDIYLFSGPMTNFWGEWISWLTSLNNQGIQNWSIFIKEKNNGLPIVDNQGTAYALFSDRVIKAIDNQGEVKWSISLPSSNREEIISLDSKRNIYVGGQKSLYVVSPALANNPPDPPTNLAQFKSDGQTEIPIGGTTDEPTVVFSANLNDPDGDRVKLQIELRRLDEYEGQFLNSFTQESELVDSGSQATVAAYGLINDDYHWQARAIDETGLSSEWVQFDGNDISQTDFTVSANLQGHVFITSPLIMTPRFGVYTVGDTITAQFSIVNKGLTPIFLKVMTVGGRGPDGEVVDFDWKQNISLFPYERYDYVGNLIIPQKAGTYSFFCTYQTEDEHWNTLIDLAQGLTDTDRAKNITVADITIGPPHSFIFEAALADLTQCHFSGAMAKNILLNKKSKTDLSDPNLFLLSDAIALAYRMEVEKRTPVDLIRDGALTVGQDFWLTTVGGGIVGFILGLPGVGEATKQYSFDIAEAFFINKDISFIRMEQMPVGYIEIVHRWDTEAAIFIFYGPDGGVIIAAPVKVQEGLLVPDLESYKVYLKYKNDITAKIKSPAELRVYDSQDRISGIVNGEVIEDIPNSMYIAEDKSVNILFDCGPYYYQVCGTGTGTYGLEIILTEDGDDTIFEANEIPTMPGVVHQYEVDWDALSLGEEGVTISIDRDGDGEYERVITSDSELTPEEFNIEPIADAGDDQTVFVGTDCLAQVSLNGSGSNDPDGGELSYTWSLGGQEIATGVNPTVELPLGVHTIELVVNDGIEDSEPDYVVITVLDNTPPELTVLVTPEVLWPPNHKMVQITSSIVVSDNCDDSPTVTLISIMMNEGEETSTFDPTFDYTLGDGHTIDDIQIINGNIYLRAERSGKGTGRIYTITYRAVDDSGNETVQSATVTVPHDQG